MIFNPLNKGEQTLYLPMQNWLKILPKRSSGSSFPVICPRWFWAKNSSSANNSSELLPFAANCSDFVMCSDARSRQSKCLLLETIAPSCAPFQPTISNIFCFRASIPSPVLAEIKIISFWAPTEPEDSRSDLLKTAKTGNLLFQSIFARIGVGQKNHQVR